MGSGIGEGISTDQKLSDLRREKLYAKGATAVGALALGFNAYAFEATGNDATVAVGAVASAFVAGLGTLKFIRSRRIIANIEESNSKFK